MGDTTSADHALLESESPGVSWKDFHLILVGALVLIILIITAEWLWFLQPLRLLLGLAYVLYVPGYCLTAALFPGADDLDNIERVGLSLGLSVAWVPVLALILDRLPWGLRQWPIVLGTLASILVFMAVALWRRMRLPAGEAYAPDLGWRPRPWWQSLLPIEKRIYRLSGAILLLAGLITAWIFLVPSPDEFMTEFYILGKEGLAEDYPREAVVGEPIWVTVGIVNREREERTYRLEVWAVDPWIEGKEELVYQEGPIHLARFQGREWPVTWSMPWAGDDQIVRFLLYTEETPEPYRKLRLWLNVTPLPPTPTHSPIATPTTTPPVISPPPFIPTPTPTPTPIPTPTPTPTLTPTPTPTSTPIPPPAWSVAHIVRPGEYLAQIATTYGAPLQEIIANNAIEDIELIYAGQVLTIPLPSAEAAMQATPPLLGAEDPITDTQAALAPPPQLISPSDGQIVTTPVQLTWQEAYPLQNDQCYVVLLWRDGQPAPGRIFFSWSPTYLLDMTDYPEDTYRWSVRIGQCSKSGGHPILKHFLSPLPEPWHFRLSISSPH